MQCIANGEDNTAIESFNNNDEQKSVGNGLTALRDLTQKDEIVSSILVLSEKVAYRMRAIGVCGRTVHLTLKDSTLNSISHSTTLTPPLGTDPLDPPLGTDPLDPPRNVGVPVSYQ